MDGQASGVKDVRYRGISPGSSLGVGPRCGRRLAWAFVAAALALGGCKRPRAMEEEKGGAPPDETPAAQAPAGKTVDATTAAVLTGTVSFAGPLPKSTMIKASSDAACAKAHPDAFSAEDVQVRDGRVTDAFVWVKSGLAGYAFPSPKTIIRVAQQGCMYRPRIIGARVDQEIEFSNEDPTLHNVSSKPEEQRGFNFVTTQGQVGRRAFHAPEVPIPVGCDVHPWMRAYVGVFDNPFFTVTGPEGTFEFGGLPPGTYRLGAWHERLGMTELEVTVGPKEQKAVTLALPGPKAE